MGFNTLCYVVAGMVCVLYTTQGYKVIVYENKVTADCPLGQRYSQECRECFCKDNIANSTSWPYPYCRKDKCPEWSCPDPPRYQKECEGWCVCNPTDRVTSCEKYCEPRWGPGVKKN